MATDFKYNVDLMEITIENGDFSLNNSVSEQNGGLILSTKNSNLYFPLIGVSLQSLINPKLVDLQNLLNLWQQQVKNDGAKSAKWTLTKDSNDNTNTIIQTECSYE